MATNPFLAQRYQAQSAGVAIVRRILQRESFPNGFTTAELYEVACKEPAPDNFKPFPLIRPGPPPVPSTSKKQKYSPPASAYPEHPDHPIRSIRFLKGFILPFLEGTQEISMARWPTAKTLAAQEAGELPKTGLRLTSSQLEWKWKVIPPEERLKAAEPKPKKKVVGVEVGVGVDTSHLNKRKQKARIGKVSREVDKMKAYQSFSAERDALIGRLNEDSELALELGDRLKRSGNRRGLQAVLEEEQLVKEGDSTRFKTSISSRDSDEYVNAAISKIQELVAYKTQKNTRESVVGTS